MSAETNQARNTLSLARWFRLAKSYISRAQEDRKAPWDQRVHKASEVLRVKTSFHLKSGQKATVNGGSGPVSGSEPRLWARSYGTTSTTMDKPQGLRRTIR